MTHLTAIVLTHNESAQIADCIKTLRFADRIIVFDSYSTDDTVSIAQVAARTFSSMNSRTTPSNATLRWMPLTR